MILKSVYRDTLGYANGTLSNTANWNLYSDTLGGHTVASNEITRGGVASGTVLMDVVTGQTLAENKWVELNLGALSGLTASWTGADFGIMLNTQGEGVASANEDFYLVRFTEATTLTVTISSFNGGTETVHDTTTGITLPDFPTNIVSRLIDNTVYVYINSVQVASFLIPLANRISGGSIGIYSTALPTDTSIWSLDSGDVNQSVTFNEVYADAFTYTDGFLSNNANWEKHNTTATDGWEVFNNRLLVSSTSTRVACQVVGQTYTAGSQYCSYIIDQADDLNNIDLGLGLHMQAPVADVENHYKFFMKTGGSQVELSKYVGGVNSQISIIDSTYTPEVLLNMIPFEIKTYSNGGRLYGLINDKVVIDVADPGDFSGGSVGVSAYMAPTNFRANNFSSGSVVIASGTIEITSSPTTVTPASTGNQIVVSGSITADSVTIDNGTTTEVQTITNQNYNSGSDQTTITFTAVQGDLQFADNHTLTVTYNTTETLTASIELDTIATNDFTDLVDPLIDDTSIFKNLSTGSSTPVTGDQVEYTEASSITVLTNARVNSTSILAFDARFWDQSEQAWGSWQTITLEEVESLTANFTTAISNLEVTFTDNSNYTGSGTLTYSWNFGDTNTSTLQNPVHTYSSAGTYTVELTVTDGTLTDSYTQQITVSEAVSLNAAYTYVENFLETTFTNTTTYDGQGTLSYSWNFGDGNTSTNASPVHTYSSAGTYTVELTVTDGTLTDSYSENITVEAAPTLDCSYTYVEDFLDVSFSLTTAYTGSGTLTYSWNFGDGNTSTVANPTHTYSEAGTYTVEVEVTDGTLTDSYSENITVEGVTLIPDFNYTVNGLEVSFTENVTYNGEGSLSYSWTFGDSGTSTLADPVHTYDDYSSYTVELEVTDGTLTVATNKQVTLILAALKVEPCYKIVNNTEGNLNIDGVTLDEGQSVNVVFKSKNIKYAEGLGLITVTSIKSESEIIANLERYIQEKYEGGLERETTITFSSDPEA